MLDTASPPGKLSPRRTRWPRTLAGRLTLSYTLTFAAVVFVMVWIAYWALSRNLQSDDDRFLADQIHVIRMVLLHRPGDQQALVQEAEWEVSARRHSSVFVRVLESSGEEAVETEGMAEILPSSAFPDPVPADREARVGTDILLEGGANFRLMSALAPLGKTADQCLIQIALNQDHHEEVLADYQRQLLGGGLLFLLASSTLVYWIARHGLRSIREVSDAAKSMRATTLRDRLELERAPLETAELASTFNEMLARLEDSFERLTRFSGSIAHELRTPVNNLLGTVEVTLSRARSGEEYRAALESNAEEGRRLARLIESLLFLARSEHPETQVEKQPVDLTREIAKLVEFYEPTANESGIRLESRCPAGFSILADPLLLQRVLSNLVENGLRHTPSGGVVQIGARRRGADCELEVLDTGSGIPSALQGRIFEPLFCVDASRSARAGGAGLGLAIVQTILRLHGGVVRLESQPGRGTRVTTVWPDEESRPIPVDQLRTSST